MKKLLRLCRAGITCLSIFAALYGDESEEQTLLGAIRFLESGECSELIIEALSGGVTNAAYKIEGSASYFAKFCRGHQDLIGSSLQAEYDILRLIAFAGLAPAPLYYNNSEGLLITEFINGSQIFLNLRDEAALSNACQPIKALHQLKVEFPSFFCPYGQLKKMMDNAQEIGAVIPTEFIKSLLTEGENWKKSAFHSAPKVPCHLDLHCRNMIEEDGRIWLIDWEYAGQSDRYYDLAVLASAESFTDAEMEMLLKNYENNGHISDELNDHFWKMRILADARWALWCYIQAVISPIDYPFSEKGDQYFKEASRRYFGICGNVEQPFL